MQKQTQMAHKPFSRMSMQGPLAVTTVTVVVGGPVSSSVMPRVKTSANALVLEHNLGSHT